MDGGIHYEDPFATPLEARQPIRRFRGRLAAGVTIWTAGAGAERMGLTMSSVLVAEGDPPSILGLMSDTTDLYERIRTSGRFVVHVLDSDKAIPADVFAGLRPSPGGKFTGVAFEESEWGPVLTQVQTRAYCSFVEETEVGYHRLMRGEVEKIELDELQRPLVYFRGRYRSLEER